MAARATFALKAGLWFRRDRLVIVSPARAIPAAVRQKRHLSPCPNSPSQLCPCSTQAFARQWTPDWSCNDVLTVGAAVERGYVPARYAAAAARGYRGVLSRVSLDAERRTNLDGTCVGTGVGDLASYLARPRLRNDLHGLGAFLLMYEQVRDRL